MSCMVTSSLIIMFRRNVDIPGCLDGALGERKGVDVPEVVLSAARLKVITSQPAAQALSTREARSLSQTRIASLKRLKLKVKACSVDKVLGTGFCENLTEYVSMSRALRSAVCCLFFTGLVLSMFAFAECKRLKTKFDSRRHASKDGVVSVSRDGRYLDTAPREKRSPQRQGSFPSDVCYCNTFATKGGQCNPSDHSAPCDCLVNFRGDRCESCTPGYWGFPDCLPCNCNPEGATNLVCDQSTGRCPCRTRIRGKKCDLCPLGHFNFPRCKACNCNTAGSHSFMCNELTGECPCKDKIAGRQCDRCLWGFFNFPDCWWCDCDPLTTKDEICDNTGSCVCKDNFQGHRCQKCMTGYYGFPLCIKCACSNSGFGTCGQYGECICRPGYTGRSCESCAKGFYGFPHCTACNCNVQGSESQSCDQASGKCTCKKNVIGWKCDMCAKDLVSFPACTKCNCDPGGTVVLPGQSKVGCFGAKQSCMCKMNVQGTLCDRCRFGYFNFSAENPSGCTTCGCSTRGTMAAMRGCHHVTGICSCKNYVTGSKCATCRDGFYKLLSHDIFGCRECRCNPGGSASHVCHKGGGECKCLPQIHGKHCNKLTASARVYIPDLHHIKAELEEGVESDGFPVLSGSDSNKFPGFSGAGYVVPAKFTEFSVRIAVPRTSTYRIIFHYALDSLRTVNVDLRLSVEGGKPMHTMTTSFLPSRDGSGVRNKLYTAESNGRLVEVELNKGVWIISMTSTSSDLLMDYVALLPEEYYKAPLLHQSPSEPCLANVYYDKHCYMYTYYTDNNTDTIPGIRGFLSVGSLKYFDDDRFDLQRPGFEYMAALGNAQVNVYYYIPVPHPGKYALVISYFQPQRIVHRIYVYHNKRQGVLEAQPCQYQFACKQVVLSDRSQVVEFDMTADIYKNKISIVAFSAASIGLISVTAIPIESWDILYLKPFLRCSSYLNKCEASTYDMPKDAVWLVSDVPSSRADKMKTPLKGVVKSRGKYHVIIHYKQPGVLRALGSVQITSGVKPLTVDVTFEFCATDSGCRVLVQWPGDEKEFDAGRLSLNVISMKETSVVYVILVPSASYDESILKLHHKGDVNDFIKYCATNHYHVTHSGRHARLCRDFVFTLTLNFNGAPFPCECDPKGALDASCSKFGGQCTCRRNVVGRKCDRCMASYTGFPNCRKCECSPVGSVSPDCDVTGHCTCTRGFGGRKCDRCASYGYYGYPNCKACNCDTRGSLSTFCGSWGQCQCRMNFEGLKCDQCRVGYYDFPRCKQCGCNPAGIRLLPGQQNTCGNGNDTKCTCKENVQGAECEQCKSMHFGLSIFNPKGCRSCGCNLNGTLGSIGDCDKDHGRCNCKAHVTGRECGRCADGYYGYQAADTFGCKRCNCKVGNSFGSYCDGFTGQCACMSNVGGIHCDRIENNKAYSPDLHHIKFEFEDGETDNQIPVAVYHNTIQFPGFSGAGYTVLDAYQSRIHMMIDIPRTTQYHVILHYTLSQVRPVGALITFTPTLESGFFPLGPASQHKLGVRFKSTATWSHTLAQYVTAKDSKGRPIEVLLSRGKWRMSMGASTSTIQLDCLILLPEAYYRPTVLKEHVTNPCEVNSADQHCLHYRYPNIDGVDVSTMSAESGRLTGRRYQTLSPPFPSVELHGQQNVLSIDVPSAVVSGAYMVIASYYHPSSRTGRLDVQLTSERAMQAGWMRILSCRYTFGCRQVAIQEDHDVQVFQINAGATISLYSRLSLAVNSVTIIPHDSWKPSVLTPAPQCVRSGPSCVLSDYTLPTDAILIQAENSTDKNGHGSPRPPYLMDFTVKLAYISSQQHTLYIYSTVQPGRYYVIVHFYQPQFLSFNGRVIVSSDSATPTLVNFRYCPFVSGCRAIGQSQERSGLKERITIGSSSHVLISVVIPEEASIWIDYLLLVPARSFQPSLLDADPIDMSQEFVQQCAHNNYHIKPSASKFCLKSVFAMTTSFNRGALPCDCDKQGSMSDSCQSYGGQCRCHSNVVGRTCNRCRPRYRRVPNTRGCVL